MDLTAYVEELCSRIDDADSAIQAFVPETGRRTRLRAEAEALQARWPAAKGAQVPGPADRPALYGVPVGVKDIIHVDGLPTRAGSALPADVLTGPEATAVTRLRDAGALIAGKTVTAEFASVAPGPTRNPHNPWHTPGGSSSGSAAAVAAALLPLALGTQTIGSVIRPAAYCGAVGFKPTYGRIPVDGVIPNAPSLDTVGVLAVDVSHAVRAAAVLCDGWEPPAAIPRAAEGASPTLGVPDGPYLDLATPPALAAFEQHIEVMRKAGLRVRRIPVLADLDHVIRTNYVINWYELARTHRSWFAAYGDRYHELTARAIRDGQQLSRSEYDEAIRRRRAYVAELIGRMDAEGIDAWIAPAATGPAPEGLASTGSPLMNLPWTLAGLPVVGLPAGNVDGLPVGLQCAARPGTDEQLLSWALTLATTIEPPHM